MPRHLFETMIENHILHGARFQQTPNISGQRLESPKYLIIHFSASGGTDGTVRELCKDNSNKSAHLVIGRDGEVVQLASFDQRAWHCGESQWNGEESLNRMSIGIELVNWGKLERSKDGKFCSWVGTEIATDEVAEATHKNEAAPAYWHKYTSEQLEVCANVAAEIFKHYNLKAVLGHDDIAPTRKTDPGPLFPMDWLVRKVLQSTEKPKGISVRGVCFDLDQLGAGVYATIEDREGDIMRLLSFDEARALRDWLNENLPDG